VFLGWKRVQTECVRPRSSGQHFYSSGVSAVCVCLWSIGSTSAEGKRSEKLWGGFYVLL